AQCRLSTGRFAESLVTLDRALDVPGLTASHRGRLLVLAARTHSISGELEKAAQVASTALRMGEEAHDAWAMAWALHTMASAVTAEGSLTDPLRLYDQALAVTEGDASLTDPRLLLQINKVASLSNLDRRDEALSLAWQARELAREAGAIVRLT